MGIKKYLALVLSIVFVLSFALPCLAQNADFAGGDGSRENPYLISTKYHLDNVRNYPDLYFKLTNDIEFLDEDYAPDGDFYNDGKGFLPICDDAENTFSCTLDGDGFSICNLQMRASNEEEARIGLFKNTDHVKISNLTIKNSEINAVGVKSVFAGFLVARDNRFSSISSCGISNDCEINIKDCQDVHVGGMVGTAWMDISFSRSYNASNITIAECGNISVGGFLGGGDISFSHFGLVYNSGKIYAQSTMGERSIIDAGGFIGHAYTSVGPNVSSSFNASEITVDSKDGGAIYTGGIAGYLGATHNPIPTEKFYSVGKVNVLNENSKFSFNPTAASRGYFDGESYGSLIMPIYCYYTDEYLKLNSELQAEYDIKMLDDEAMKKQESFENWDFEETWTMEGNEEYPYPELKVVEMVLPQEALKLEVGDIDADKKVNSRDVATLQKYILSMFAWSRDTILRADINGDNKINSRDMATLQKKVIF
ncbi:MAG: dockerin type I repeat-containing protein [Clostridia bacterium]|nr:dockerin type I repeat-containing protein [Clostridia bacterium]